MINQCVCSKRESHAYMKIRLIKIKGAHFSSIIGDLFVELVPTSKQIKLSSLAVNVNNIYPIKYRGKPITPE